MKTNLNFLKVFHKARSDTAHRLLEYYSLNDFFEAIVEIFGINLATQIVVDSGNLEWVLQFAGQYNEKSELTVELREKLAHVILASKNETYCYSFFRFIRQVSNKVRKNLLDSSFVKDQLVKEKLLQEPAIGF